MSSNVIKQWFRSASVTRITYPLGVVVVFSVIILASFFSFRFFLTMVQHITTLPPIEKKNGITFPLDAYRTVASFFHLTEPVPTVREGGREKISIALNNKQPREEILVFLQGVLKNDGWIATLIVDKEQKGDIAVAPFTTIAGKALRQKDLDALNKLLTKNGFVVFRTSELLETEKYDIVITLGAY